MTTARRPSRAGAISVAAAAAITVLIAAAGWSLILVPLNQ